MAPLSPARWQLFPVRRPVCVAGCVAALATFCPAAALDEDVQLDELKNQLQAMLDEVSTRHGGTPLQLGWKSDSTEFALASGQVKLPGSSQARPTTVNDTFLFGSGVKPFTAAAVMALRDRGLVSLDDPLERHVDPALAKLRPGASLRGLFGEGAARITVGHTLRMQSGVQDFDLPPFDNYLLRANETNKVHSPYEFVEYASTQTPSLLCEPGTCVAYSSNNFILAGFILLTHANVTNWWDLDLASFLPSDEARRALGGSRFFQKERLDTLLTVPGRTGGGWAKTPLMTIWNQSSSVLGWTCGNLVGTASDMAGFIWGLLGPNGTVLPPATIKEMTTFKPLDLGWGAGFFQYGAGVMIESVKFTPGRPPIFPDWGTYMGHGGDTFGFLSEQGIISGIFAAVSIVAADETASGIVQQEAFCRMIKIAAKVVRGKTLLFPCYSISRSRQSRKVALSDGGPSGIASTTGSEVLVV